MYVCHPPPQETRTCGRPFSLPQMPCCPTTSDSPTPYWRYSHHTSTYIHTYIHTLFMYACIHTYIHNNSPCGQASNITTPNGLLEVNNSTLKAYYLYVCMYVCMYCYDERGHQYKVPMYCIANPLELVQDSQSDRPNRHTYIHTTYILHTYIHTYIHA